MSPKFLIYILSTILVIWSMESVDINRIFKKNRVMKARIFYFLLGISLIYLVTNFFIDIYESVKFF